MSKFEVLCVTMNQTDFSKIQEMNLHSDVVFANQAGTTTYEELEFEGHTARMITTATRGVGVNRNLALMYANADICLFADDDVKYVDDMEQRIVDEFEAHPDADVMIFNLTTENSNRAQKQYLQTKKCGPFTKMPWGGVRIAFRLHAVKKANIYFTSLFGGGCIFPSGEDSMWLTEAKRKGLTFYVSKEVIGSLACDESTWFTGYDENFFFGKGAFYQAVHPKSIALWKLYFAWRTKSLSNMKFSEKMKWMKCGSAGYQKMLSYAQYSSLLSKEDSSNKC